MFSLKSTLVDKTHRQRNYSQDHTSFLLFFFFTKSRTTSCKVFIKTMGVMFLSSDHVGGSLWWCIYRVRVLLFLVYVEGGKVDDKRADGEGGPSYMIRLQVNKNECLRWIERVTW